MPGNDIPENIHNFFGQDNTSEGRQAQGGSWPVFDNNPWATRQNVGPFGINSNNYASQSLDPEQGNGMQPVQTPFSSNPILNPEVNRSQPSNLQLNLNGYMHGSQGIQANSFQANVQGSGLVSDSQSLMQRHFSNIESQQSSAPAYISGLTKGSNRSESTEAPVNFDFLGGQQMMSRQNPGISQPRPIQPQRIGDMQMWQQQLMFKQIQEMQRKQLLQQFQQGGRQQIPLSQLSEVGRQASSNQIPAILNGMPINNASENMWSSEHFGADQKLASSSAMYLAGNIDRAQRAEPSMQGIPNGLVFSRNQGQAVRSMGFSPQRSDQSLYGTPVASAKGSPSHQSQFQGAQEKALMQTSTVNYFQSEQPAVPMQGYLQDSISLSKQGFEGKRLLHDATAQGGTASGNLQEMNRFSPSIQVQEMSGMLHEKAGEQVRSSHVVANLDPTEEKLLFSTDDGNQNASLAGDNERGTGGYFHGNLSQSNDYFSSLPTINSGSWSALMQEAVEASSSETGLNEEWSGLSFQKTDMSPGNHGAMLPNNNGNQQATWDDGNLRNASRPLPLFNDVSESPNCHATTNIQQSLNFSPEQSERVSADALRESYQRPSTETTNNPFLKNHQQKQLSGSNVQNQAQSGNMFNGVWTGQTCEQPAGSSHSSEVELNSQNMQNTWPHHRMMPMHSHPTNQPNGWNTLSLGATGNNTSKFYDNDSGKQVLQKNDMSNMNMEAQQRGNMWKSTGTQAPTSFPNSAARTETARPDTGTTMRNGESSTDTLVSIMNPNNLNMNRETNQQILGRHHEQHRDAYLNSNNEENTKYQNQVSGLQQPWDSSIYKRNSGGSYPDRPENSHQEDVLREGFAVTNSQPIQNKEVGSSAGGNSSGVGSESQSAVNNSLKPSGQTGRKTVGPRRFQFHPMGNLEMSKEPIGSPNHTSYSLGPSQSVDQEFNTQDQGYVAHSQISGHVVNNAPDIGKGLPNDLQRNAKAAEGMQYRGTFSSHPVSSALDGSTLQFSQDQRIGSASRNMLELLHKVDQTRVGQTVEGFSFPEINTPSGIPGGEASDGSASQLQLGHSSALQGFGLKLGPPSQRQSVSDHSLASQTSVETANNFNQRNVESGAREEDPTRASFTSIHSPSLPHDAPQKENLGNKSSLPEHTRNEGMYSNFQGNSSTATSFKLKVDQSLTPQQQQQLLWQQQQKQLIWQQQQKQLQFASASRPPPSNQLPFLPFGRQVGFSTKQSPHPGKRDESHTGAILDQSSKELLPSAAGGVPSSRLVPSADTCPSSASQFYAVSTVSSQPRNASSHIGSSGQQASVVETRSAIHPATSTVSQQAGSPSVLHNVWTSVSSRQRLSGVQPQQIISDVRAPQKADNLNKRKGESSELSSRQFLFDETRLVKDNSSHQMQPEREIESQGPELESQKGYSLEEGLSKGNYAQDSKVDANDGQVHVTRTTSSNCDIGTHGQSVEPSDISKQNSYSLLQQMHAMKDADSDPSRRAEKRLKGAEFGADTMQMGWAPGQRYNYGQRTSLREMDATSQNIPFPPDVTMLSFSSRDNKANSTNSSLQVSGREAQSHAHGKPSVLPIAGNSERPQISPQMAPSWFEKYGSYRSGQVLTRYDGLGNSQRSLKAAEQIYGVSNVSESIVHHAIPEKKDDASEIGGIQQSTSATGIAAHQSPSHPPLELIDNNMSLIPMKRKIATSDLLPFYKEVTQGCQKPQSISIMEQEWARVTNRLIDKLEEEFDPIEDVVSKSRSRRRLILTSQLMQQILPFVPATCITKDATTSYESVIYLMARSILGDACSLASCSESDSCIDADSESMMSKTTSTSKKKDYNHFSRSMEDFIGKSKKLKDDFLRLERNASLLDVRLDCQELERHSIMNHFVRFLGRSQSERVESSLTSQAAPHRSFPQRHVTVVMAKNLPEGVNCLSL